MPACNGGRSAHRRGARIRGRRFKRESALGFGATHTQRPPREAIDLVRELTRGVMADAVVVASATIDEDDVGTALRSDPQGRHLRAHRVGGGVGGDRRDPAAGSSY